MINKLLFIFTPLILLSFNSCKNVPNNHLSWNYILDFKIGSLYKENRNYFLPFSYKDLLNPNSATVRTIIKSEIDINENEIIFYFKYKDSLFIKRDKINKIKLGKINPGTYTVYYVSENKEKIFIDNIIIEQQGK
jgi:hypothetical protein